MEVINTRPLLEGDTDSENEEEIPSTSPTNTTVFVDDMQPIFKPSQPVDHYHMAYYLFYLLGIVSLLPWNFFITADDYWMYKFRDPNSKLLLNGAPPKRTPLQASFISYVTIASNIPSILFLVLNVVLIQKVALQIRMIGSLVTMFSLFVVTTVFVKVNTDAWQQLFFYMTLGIIVLLNMASSVFLGSLTAVMGKFTPPPTVFVKVNTDAWQQLFFYMTLGIIVLLNMASSVFLGSLTAVMGKFTPPYITAVVSSQALGGVFAATAQIVALMIGASSEHSAFVYFTVGNVVILVAMFCYIALAKTTFFKFYLSEKIGVLNTQSQVRPRIINYKAIYKKTWAGRITALITFFVTLAVYPGVTVLIESEGRGHGFRWNDVYFVPVVNFLLFNMGDFIGRIVAGRLQWPRKGWVMLVFGILRICLIPPLLFCNAQPRENLPVFFNKDYQYIIIMLLFSISHGYIINLTLLWAPRVVESHEKETASSIIGVFIGGGLVLGSFTSVLIVKYL